MKIRTYEVHERFNIFLRELGIPSVKVEYYYTNYLNIFVQKIDEIKESKMIAEKFSDKIISRFIKLLSSENIYDKQYEWSAFSVTNVLSLDAIHIDSLIQKSKNYVREKIEAEIDSEYIPQYIFSHSSNYNDRFYPGGYSIVFKSKERLERSRMNIQGKIIDICNRVLIDNDRMNIFQGKYLAVEFYDVTDANVYGLSRED